jgi:DNA-binding MarR family transcriptional regulator
VRRRGESMGDEQSSPYGRHPREGGADDHYSDGHEYEGYTHGGDGGNDRSGLNRRGVVYEYIRMHPGTHVRAMAKDLHLGTGDLQYHLFWLEKHGFVKTKKGGFYRHVFPTSSFDDDQEVLLSVLSQETPREILLLLLHRPDMTQGDIARRLGHSQPSISWRMDRLLKLGMIRKKRASGGGGSMVYEVAADRDDTIDFVKNYHAEVWKRWAGRFTGIAGSGRMRIDGAAHGLESVNEKGLIPPPVVEMIGRS